MKIKIKIIIKIKRIIAKEIPTAMPIVFGWFKWGFEIFAIWIIEENPPKTKIWANNSPAINPVKFEQVKEVRVTELTWQLGFVDNKNDE